MPPLFLHVGLAKTGTTFLQTLLAENRPALREAGFIYPFLRAEGMFHAAAEVREDHERWGLDPALIAGSWEALLDKARGFDGTAVISHELLAAATPEQVRAAAGGLRGTDLHVVLTARDPARQVPAHWQEAVKNGATFSFADFTAEVLGEPGAADSRFWAEQDLLAVADRWATLVPPERVHVVVCPPAGADPLELWRRFAGVVGLPAGLATTPPDRRANRSLGAAEVHLLRAVNALLGDRLDARARAHVVKRLFAQRLLSEVASPPARTPESLRAALDALADGWVAGIADRGFTVHGDLEELRPRDFGQVHPDELVRHSVAGVPDAMAALLVEIAALRSSPEPAAAGSRDRPVSPRPRTAIDRLRSRIRRRSTG
jgi:hypothetical protein